MCQATTKSGSRCRRPGDPYCAQHAATVVGPNRAALELAVSALATARQHEALVESCRGLADVLDMLSAGGRFDDRAWREYRLALKALMGATSSDADDGIDSLVDAMRAEMGDTADA